MIKFDRYDQGKRNILTMSYDDGVTADRKLVSIFNRYSIRGTFHLNSGQLGKTERYLKPEEIAALYQGHEVSVHTLTHPHLGSLPTPSAISEVMEDRKNLEALCGYPVRGMSYPFGTYNAEVLDVIRLCGIEYSRTTQSTKGFSLPQDFLQWHPTCHHNNDLLQLADRFINDLNTSWRSNCFYVWGHAYEFDNNENWDLIETFCSKMSGLEDVWYATNMEICDYVKAQRNLKISADQSIVFNPAARTLWFSVDGETIEIKGGETLHL